MTGKCLVQIMLTVFSLLLATTASAQYREESGALEQIYESRVRSALNTIMRPGEFSIVVSVDINRDPKQLGDVEAEIENLSLPGVPGLSIPENMNLSNKLHELRNRINVQLVLDESVTKEIEIAAKAMAMNKLHMDESAGDSITVLRTSLMLGEPRPNADVLPELSWRMWALVVLLGLLALGFLFLALNRRKQATPEKPEEKPEEKAEEKPLEAKQETPVVPELPVAPAIEASKEEQELVALYESKKSLTDLSGRYPEAASRALDEQFDKGRQNEVMLACESLGWEAAKTMYPGITHRTWGRLGAMMMQKEKPSTTSEYLAAIDFCYRSVIAKYLELADGDAKNPFAFLLRMLPDDQKRILTSESPQTIAQVCAYLDAGQKTEILENLDDELQQATLLEMARLTEVPYETLQQTVNLLRVKVQTLKDKPVVSVNGRSFLIDLLRELDVIAEVKFLERLKKEDPAALNDLRKSYLQFADLNQIPQEIIGNALGTMDISVMTQAFSEAPPDISFHCFQALPEKRAKMVERDLSYSKGFSQKQILSARRTLLKAVNAQLLIEGRDPGSYFGKPVRAVPGNAAGAA